MHPSQVAPEQGINDSSLATTLLIYNNHLLLITWNACPLCMRPLTLISLRPMQMINGLNIESQCFDFVHMAIIKCDRKTQILYLEHFDS